MISWSGKHAADMTTKLATTARRRPPPLGVFRKHGIKREPRDDPHYNHPTGALDQVRAR
jgi:hypothetical protein